MTAEDLIRFYTAFSRQMLDNPVLGLALTVSTFDPVGVYYEADLVEEADAPHPAIVLLIARRSFPDFYAAACEMLLAGMDIGAAAVHTANQISGAMGGLEVYGWEGFHWGIPMPAYGVDWEEPTTDVYYARLLAAFDRASASDIDDLDCQAARLVMDSLPPHPTWQQIAHLLGHFFSLTGNSCIDCTWETLAELHPLFWQPEDIELAQAIIHEANDLLGSAAAGLMVLEGNSALFHVLRSTVRWLRQKLETFIRDYEEDNHAASVYFRTPVVDIEWPDPV